MLFYQLGVYEYKGYYTKKIEELEKSYIYKHKLLIKEEVSSLIETFRFRYDETYNELKVDLSERIDNIINLYKVTKKSNKSLKREEFLKKVPCSAHACFLYQVFQLCRPAPGKFDYKGVPFLLSRE